MKLPHIVVLGLAIIPLYITSLYGMDARAANNADNMSNYCTETSASPMTYQEFINLDLPEDFPTDPDKYAPYIAQLLDQKRYQDLEQFIIISDRIGKINGGQARANLIQLLEPLTSEQLRSIHDQQSNALILRMIIKSILASV